MATKREEAAKILAQIPQGEGIRSDKQPDLFTKWTGYTHKQMLESWRQNMKGPKLLTACGGFAGTYAGLIGITGLNSVFDLEQSLIDAGKAHAWVRASSGAKPQVGDILRHTVFHVDVAAGWEGPKLKRVAAGQSLHPRPTTNVENEFDCLKWVTGGAAYNPANLQGWLDLDKFFGAAPAPGPSLGWLQGWWKVFDGNTYYYAHLSSYVGGSRTVVQRSGTASPLIESCTLATASLPVVPTVSGWSPGACRASPGVRGRATGSPPFAGVFGRLQRICAQGPRF